VDPVRELPYGPAVQRRANRPDRWQHPTTAKTQIYSCIFRGVHRWESLSWPDSGEFAGTTYFVTDDAGARLRISRSSQRLDAIAVFTDGIERLALDFAQSKPFAPFFDGMMRPLAGVQIQGRSSAISEKLGSFLASETVNSRTDDDKTLILARRL